MQDPVPEQARVDVSVGPQPDPPPRSDGLGWSLLASIGAHAAVALFVIVDACAVGVTGEMTRDPIAERAFVVVPVDESTFARLRREAESPVEEPPPDASAAPERAVRGQPSAVSTAPRDDVPRPSPEEAVSSQPSAVSRAPRSDRPSPSPEVERERVQDEPLAEAERPDDDPREPPEAARARVREPLGAPPPDLARREDPPEPEPRPTPEPPPLPDPIDDVAYRRFLEVDRLQESPVDVDEGDYIGARDALPDRATRAPVTADEAGPSRPSKPTTAVLPSAAAAEVRAGDPAARRDVTSASRADDEGAATTAGGPRGDAAGDGAAGVGGDGWEGGEAAPRSAARPARDGGAEASTAAEAAPATSTVARAEPTDPGDAVLEAADGADDLGASEAPREASQPSASAPSRAGSAATDSASSAANASDGDAVAMLERPGDGADRGGSGGHADERAGGAAAGSGGGSGDGEQAADPVADLRADLGWGEVDRESLRGSEGRAASPGSVGSVASSPQGVVLDDVEIGPTSWARVSESPLGRYTEEVYAIVRARWHERDLDEDSKALGVQGRVTLVFRVYRNGDVSPPEIERSSGHDILDRLAVSAVPDRLPRFPRDLGGASVVQRITFNYRNPLIAGEDR